MTGDALVYLLVFLGGMLAILALTGLGEQLEARSDWFHRFLDRTVGRPDGWGDW